MTPAEKLAENLGGCQLALEKIAEAIADSGLSREDIRMGCLQAASRTLGGLATRGERIDAEKVIDYAKAFESYIRTGKNLAE